ncbi:serine/threonine-protein kinase [Amycolatopsis umgeniensis]|uniref:Protein kinase domain-containing protein n=1 Tax=Amycolatopsis umgeniensis TaxID=336628 RepID=A0A841BH53_9PSEU|nr:hypothetical protein [Amycolatopsis umgeniensis]
MGEDRTIAGRYRLDEHVGSGGMGSVWRALDLELGRVVALKHSTLADGGQIRREARIGAGLHHPRVVTVFDVIVDEDARWLVMEYLPSRSLGRVLADDGPLSPEAAARVGAQVADALAAMHDRSMVHRDVTPENILVVDDGTVKLTDFGIARWSEVTRTGGALLAGTPGYLPPEVAAGDESGPGADVFALGATLFAAVEGRSPWGGAEEGPYAQIRRAASGVPTTPESAGDLGPVLSAMLATTPADRPTARAAKSMLEKVGGIDLASAPVTMGASAPRRAVRRWGLGAAAAVLVAVTAGTTLAIAERSAPTTTQSAVPAGMATMGDQRSADPCALLLEETVSRYGKVFRDTEYGNFNRCGLWIKPGPTGEEIVSVGLELLEPDTGAGPTGDFGVKAWMPEAGGTCERFLDLLDAHRARIVAESDTVEPKNLCPVAESVLTGAMSVAARGPVPRRPVPFASNSLATLKACELLGNADIVTAAGVELPPSRGFGDWDCAYTDNREIEADVTFYRIRDFEFARPGKRMEVINGRRAVYSTFTSGDDKQSGCRVKLEFKPYTKVTEEGNQWIEVIHFDVELDSAASPDKLCSVAETMARAVAGRIPFG